jgi:hypothetical protein
MYSGEMSMFSVALGKMLVRPSERPIDVGVSWMIQDSAFHAAPTPRPMKTVFASAPPRSPATSTSAQAVPSG